jgi:hypothetical protein
MTKTFILFATFALLLTSCNNNNLNSELHAPTIDSMRFDTSRYAIISDDSLIQVNYSEIQLIYSVLLRLVDSISLKRSRQAPLDIRRYKFQIKILTSKVGQKLFWVNSFCDNYNLNWRNEIYSVKDGGPCYFNAKIDITTMNYFDLSINGSA